MKEWEVDFTIEGRTSFFCKTKKDAEKWLMNIYLNYVRAYIRIAVLTVMKSRTYIVIQRIKPRAEREK